MTFFPHDQMQDILRTIGYKSIFVKMKTILVWPMVAPLVVNKFGHEANLLYISMV